MYPFKATRKDISIDYITGETSLIITELLLDSLADERFEHCIGRTSTCKGWNKDFGDYVMDSYTFIKPVFKRNREDEFYEEIYYFKTQKESDDFHTGLSKIMEGKSPF